MAYAVIQSMAHGSGAAPSQVARARASQSVPRSTPARRAAFATASLRFGTTSAARTEASPALCRNRRSIPSWR